MFVFVSLFKYPAIVSEMFYNVDGRTMDLNRRRRRHGIQLTYTRAIGSGALKIIVQKVSSIHLVDTKT